MSRYVCSVRTDFEARELGVCKIGLDRGVFQDMLTGRGYHIYCLSIQLALAIINVFSSYMSCLEIISCMVARLFMRLLLLVSKVTLSMHAT